VTPQEIWWNTYWAALTGLAFSQNACIPSITRLAEEAADETVRAFVHSDGTVYDPRPSDYGVGK
jgi:hypothetical protein